MKKVTVLVCNSGLGHLKRVLHLIDLLCERSAGTIEWNVFVDERKLRKFPMFIDKFKVQKYKVNFFNISSDIVEYEQDFLSKDRLYLDQADYIWSDNLIFPLKHRKEVFLTGSFLWFEVMPEQVDLKREEEIFFRRQPILIGNRDFTTSRLQAVSSFIGVGIYNYFPYLIKARNESKGILLSCGGTVEARKFFQKELPAVREVLNRTGKEIEIFVEPDFYDALEGPNVHKADFSSRMFESVAAAVTRPGMGTVCDTLSTGGRIFAFHEEENNFEVRHNALVLETLNAGKKYNSVVGALQSAFEYVSDMSARKRHSEVLQKLDFHGLDQTVEKIMEILN